MEFSMDIKLDHISHRKFTKHLQTIRKELNYRHCVPPMRTAYDTESIEFYHPKFPRMIVMEINEVYEDGKFVKRYYENAEMVALITHYARNNQ